MAKVIIELYFISLILLISWANEVVAVFDFFLGVALYYLLFRSITIYFSLSILTKNKLQWLLNRFHFLLLIHSLMFIAMFAYIDFDFFYVPGDWDQYHADGIMFSNYLKGSGSFTPIVKDAIAYSSLIGLIYYLFSDSIFLAVFINIFFVVVSSIILYLLMEELFDTNVAKLSLYISAFYPILFINEISLWKECFIYFLFTLGSLVTYRALRYGTRNDIITTIIVYLGLYNVRFFLILPFVLYILYHFVFVNRKKWNIALFFILLSSTFYYLKSESNGVDATTFIDYAFVSGISLTDRNNGLFNYQVVGLNPIEIIGILIGNWSYYIERIPLYFADIWTLSRIYYVPFLSEKYVIGKFWIHNIFYYLNSLFAWLFMFVSLWGFKKFMFDLRKNTAVLWMPIIINPLIVSIFSNNQRYMFVLIYSTIPCIAYGLVHCVRYKDYVAIACSLIIFLTIFTNKNTFIIYPIFSLIILLFGYIAFSILVRKKPLVI